MLRKVEEKLRDGIALFDYSFIHRVLLEEEFDLAVRFGDLGRMREVSRQWVHFFKGARLQNYANGLLERFILETELPPDFQIFYDAARLVDETGEEGGYVATDLTVEHDIGAIKVGRVSSFLRQCVVLTLCACVLSHSAVSQLPRAISISTTSSMT